MPPNDPNAHSASVEVAVPAVSAFAFMADGLKQNHWALGSQNRKALGDDLFVGQSSFDGSDLYVRIDAYPDLLLVDYATGAPPDSVVPTVEARIRKGSWMGRDDEVSVITLTVWKWPDADRDDWEMHYHLWKTEVHLIKGPSRGVDAAGARASGAASEAASAARGGPAVSRAGAHPAGLVVGGR